MIGFQGGAIGADLYCDRTGIHCPHDRRLRQDPRRLEGPGRRLLRSARSLYDGAALVRASTPYAATSGKAGGEPETLQGHAARRHPGIDVRSARIEDGGADRRRGHAEIKTVLGGHLGATLVESPIHCGRPIPKSRQMKTDYRRALARLVPVFMPDLLFRLERGRPAGVQEFAAAIVRPSSCQARSSARARCSRSITASRWRKGASRRRRISILPRSSSRSWR